MPSSIDWPMHLIYIRIFTNKGHDDVIADISAKMELLIEELSNSKDGVLLEYLNKYPILSTKAHKSPFDNQWLNLLARNHCTNRPVLLFPHLAVQYPAG